LCCYGEVLYKATNVQYKNDSDEWAYVQEAGEQMNNDDDDIDDSDELWNSSEDGEFKKIFMKNWLCCKLYVYML
jgi:hypothetical protein